MSCALPSRFVERARAVLPMVYGMTIVWLFSFPLLTWYWQRDNNGPMLSPEGDYRLEWMSDADYRGLEAATGPEYVVPGGRKTYAAGATWKILRPDYEATSPDGRWHVAVLARGTMPSFVLRSCLGMAALPLGFAIGALGICLFRRRPNSSENGTKKQAEFSDLLS